MIYLICITGCSSNDNLANIENRLSQLQNDINELKTKVDLLSKENKDSAFVSNKPTETSLNVDEKNEETSEIVNTPVETENSFFFLDDMSAEEISNTVFSLLQDFPEDKYTMELLQEHYSKSYNLDKVDVFINCNNDSQSYVIIQYNTDRNEIIHRDYVSSITYFYPFTIMKDNTIQYNRKSKAPTLSSISFSIYGDYDKANTIKDLIIKNEDSIIDNSELRKIDETLYIFSNPDDLTKQITFEFRNNRDADYYIFNIQRNNIYKLD